MNIPIISVIVPVYNVSEYLPKCIESILEQSFVDYELLLIDDGSTDDSGEICDQYALKDSRIKVFHQENKRLSGARNTGMDSARGKWIAFIDSDDWILKDYLKDLYAEVEGEEVTDILVVQGHTKYKNGEMTDTFAFEEKRVNNKELMDVFNKYNLHCYGYAWAKLYSNSVIQSLHMRFDTKVNYCEDLLFMSEYLNHVSCVKFSSKVNYIYLLRPSGLSNKYNCYKEEKYLCDNIWKNIFSLHQKVNKDAEVTTNMNNYHASLLLRAITCMYRPGFFLKAEERLENLKQLTDEEVSYLYHCYKTSVFGYPFLLLYEQKPKQFDRWFLILFRSRYRFDKIWSLIQKHILKM